MRTEERPPPKRARRVRRVLVTGGAGYLGATLVRGLLAGGFQVRALDSLERGDAGIRALYPNPDFELARGDVRRVETVVRAMRDADAVIHLAGLADDRACRRDPAAARELNVAATSLVAEVACGLGVARMALASTLDVYGARARQADEAAAPEPESLFGATKLEAERAMLAAADGEFRPVALRFGELFGAGAWPRYETGLNRVVASVWRRGGTPRRQDSRPVYRTHILDACAALRQALVCHQDAIAGEVFNIGCERNRCTDADVRRLLFEARPELAPMHGAQSGAEGPEISFAKQRARLGVVCRGTLRQGVEEALQALSRKGGLSQRPAWLAPGIPIEAPRGSTAISNPGE